MRAVLRLLVILAGAITLTGCLSLDTTIELNRDGSGTIAFAYRIDADAYDLGVFDVESQTRPIPVTREDFERADARVSGVSLRRHTMARDEERNLVLIDAVLSFDSIAALNAFYSPGQTAFDLSSQREQTVFRQLIAPGGGVEGSSLAADLQDYELSFTVRAPQTVQASSPSRARIEGTTATMSASLAEVATRETPLTWEVTW